MPTNTLRSRGERVQAPGSRGQSGLIPMPRNAVVGITAGDVRIRVELTPGRTAERLWAALPLFSTAEPWGDVIHFELPVEIGRDRSARINAVPGEVYLWAEEDRVLMPFGPTPISRAGEIRLPRPCNVLARALDDLSALRGVMPGSKVSVERMTTAG